MGRRAAFWDSPLVAWMARQCSLSRMPVRSEQTAEELLALHPADRADPDGRLSLTCSHAAWNAIADALMRALLVEKTLICVNDAPQALEPEEDEMVEALSTRAENPALAMAIRVRGPVGTLDGLHASVLEHSVEPT